MLILPINSSMPSSMPIRWLGFPSEAYILLGLRLTLDGFCYREMREWRLS